MDIILQKEEDVKLVYVDCPRCHQTFNSGKRKKTLHHALPQFLKPKTQIRMTLCKECHEELNDSYKMQDIQAKKHRFKSSTYEEFFKTYSDLRCKFYEKKINRGTFGEGLWSNLVTYLEATSEKKK